MEIRAQKQPIYLGEGIELYMFTRGQDRKVTGVVTDFVVTTYEQGFEARPTATINIQEAQILMDSLWESGVRPAEGTGSAGSMLATQKHLNDMRAIVQKTLDVSLK